MEITEDQAAKWKFWTEDQAASWAGKALVNAYKTRRSHTFLIQGNVGDFPETAGQRHGLLRYLAVRFDSFVKRDLIGLNYEDSKIFGGSVGLILSYTPAQGLRFIHPDSQEVAKREVKGFGSDPLRDIIALIDICQETFKDNKIAQMSGRKLRTQNRIFLVLPDPEFLPAEWVGAITAWASDESVGNVAMFALTSKSISRISPAILEHDRILAIDADLPDEQHRLAWLQGFDNNMQKRTKKRPLRIGSNNVFKINLAEGYSLEQMAKDSEGLRIIALEDIIVTSWLSGLPIDATLIAARQISEISQEVQKQA